MRAAVIGLGYWGANWGRTLWECPDIEQVVGVDPSEEARHAYLQRHPYSDVTSSLEQVLDDPAIEAVIVATPASTHYSVARQCLLAGKHVLVEKPAVTRLDEARSLAQVAVHQGQTLMVGHTALFTAEFESVRNMVTEGELGSLIYFDACYGNVGRVRPDTNVLWDLAPHPLAQFAALFVEPVAEVQAWGLNQSREHLDTCHVLLRTVSGAIGHIRVSWRYPVKTRRWVVGGTRRTVVVDEVALSQRVQVFDLNPRTGRVTSLSVPPRSQQAGRPLDRELLCFLENIRSGSSNTGEAMRWMDTMELLSRAESTLGGVNHAG